MTIKCEKFEGYELRPDGRGDHQGEMEVLINGRTVDISPADPKKLFVAIHTALMDEQGVFSIPKWYASHAKELEKEKV